MHTSERATRPRQRSAATGGRAPRAGYLYRAGLTPKRKPCTNPEGFGLLKGMCRAPAGVGADWSSGAPTRAPGLARCPRSADNVNVTAQPEGAEPEGTRAGHTPRRAAQRTGPARDPVQEGVARQQRSNGAAGVARARHVPRWGQCRRWNSREPPSQPRATETRPR